MAREMWGGSVSLSRKRSGIRRGDSMERWDVEFSVVLRGRMGRESGRRLQ